MAAVLTVPARLCNAALTRIGYARRIGNMYEGSPASIAALSIYGQTRDDKLCSFEWGFAERNAKLALLKQAPAGGYVPPAEWNPADNPPLPWTYEYAYPADCLNLRALRPPTIFASADYDPKPVEYRVVNDGLLAPPAKVILCNIASAYLIYTAQVTDPASWDSDFTEAFIDALGKGLAPLLAHSDQAGFAAEKMAAQQEAADTAAAATRLG